MVDLTLINDTGKWSATRVRRKRSNAMEEKLMHGTWAVIQAGRAVGSPLPRSSSLQTIMAKHNAKPINGVFCVDAITLQFAMATE